MFDLVSRLVRGYETGKKDLFANHIERIYQQMLLIHKDYVAGFREAKRYLEDPSRPARELIPFLKERRMEDEVERDEVAKSADAFGKAERKFVGDETWTLVRAYSHAVQKYFSYSSGVAGISWYSHFIDDIELRLRLGLDWGSGFAGEERLTLLNEVDKTLAMLPRAFADINTYYSLLRTKLLP